MDLSFGALLLAVVIGALGMGLFIYGRKQGRLPHLVAGMALVAYPYFVPNPWIMAGIAVGVLAGLWGAVRAGA